MRFYLNLNDAVHALLWSVLPPSAIALGTLAAHLNK